MGYNVLNVFQDDFRYIYKSEICFFFNDLKAIYRKARAYDLNSIILNFLLHANLLHTKVKVSDLTESCEINRIR